MNRLTSFLSCLFFSSCLALGQTNPQAPRAGAETTLQADVHRLLLLSLQLQGHVQKSRRFELSVPVVLEASQIETLAKALRTRQSSPR